jgi:hypothetical protein
VLEIVERILAALIILALLTLLIILAFPVPARQSTGPAPTPSKNETPRRDGSARGRDTPPAPLQPDIGGSSSGQTEAELRAEDARRRAEDDARARENAYRERRRPIRRADSRGCPNDGSDCGCDHDRRRRVVRRSTLPYWAEPRRRYAVRDEDPDWFDERGYDPGPPPGTCPD